MNQRIAGFSNVHLPNLESGPNGSELGYTTLPVAYIRGERGNNITPVDTVAELTESFGKDGDSAVVLNTGAFWEKVGILWTDTGKNFWGTTLPDAGIARDEAVAAKEAAEIARDDAIEAATDAETVAASMNGATASMLGSQVVGPVAITGAGTAVTNTSVYYWPGSLSNVDQYLETLELGFGATTGTVRIVFAHVESDGTLSAIPGVDPIVLPVVAGPNSINSGLSIFKPAGSVMGIQRTGVGTLYYTTGAIPNGEVEWFTAAIPTSHTAKTIGAVNGPQWKATYVGEIAAKARAAYAAKDKADELELQIGGEQSFGWSDPIVNTGSATTANYTIVPQIPMPSDGFITEVTIGGAAAGPILLKAVDMSGTTVADIDYATSVNIANAVNVLPVEIPVLEGQYLSFGGANMRYQAFSNPQGVPIWIKSPVTTPLAEGDVLTASTQHRFEVSFKFKNGLRADVDRALAGAIRNTGLNVLTDADHSAGADATSVFSTGAAIHPYPYADPGDFSVTTMPRTGEGFWGPGKPIAGGERFFIPVKPSLHNLYDAARASLAEHIANNDVLGLIADSRGHFAFASTGANHWWNRLTRFLNLGIAADEPEMTALRPSSTYVPTFYGVSLTYGGAVLPASTAWATGQNYSAVTPSVVSSGTGTYVCTETHTSGASFDATKFALVASTGSRGPLGETLILSAGAGISFAGAYEQIDVHYTQDVAAGSLEFAFNGGAAFKTVVATGALTLDRYSGPTLTGQAASGTYTVKATGAPVEITGLIRLGIKAAGSRPRLRTLRAAHGSYTIASFSSTRLTSIMAQATAFGGRLVPVIDLGINDSFGTAPATIADNLTQMLDLLEAGGCDRIIVLPPTRPSSAWNSSYTGGRTYDAALGAIRQVCRGRNVQVIGADCSDYINNGKYSDGLHFNDAGNDLHAQRFLEGLAAGHEHNHKSALAAAKLADDLDILVNGRTIAAKLVENSGATQSPSSWQAKTVTAGDVIKWKVKAKKGELKRLNLFSNSGTIVDCTFDLDLATVAAGGSGVTSATIGAIGNGWYQLEVNAVAGTTSSGNYQHRIFKDTGGNPHTGDGVSGLYIGESELWRNGVQIFTSTRDFSQAAWVKQHLTVQANAALFVGAILDLANIGEPYDDGSAALVGKKWAALGSSITIGAYYASLLAGQTSMVLTNLGVSGSALGLSTTGYASYGMSARIADIPADTQLVTLEPGPNAFGAQETPLGVFGDTTYATVYGSIWKAIMDIRVQAPGAKIVLIGVYSGGPGHATHRLGRTNGQGNTMDQHMKAEREVCQALGVPYIDTSMSGMGYHTSTLYMADELHPNAAGSLRLATHHAGALRKLVLNGLFVN